MKLVHDWYMVQAGINDPQGRKMCVNEELMGAFDRIYMRT